MLKPYVCVGGAAIKRTLSLRPMLGAKATFFYSSIAPFHLALFLDVQMLVTPSSRLSGRVAPFPSAEPVGTMFEAETTSDSTFITPVSRADTIGTMFPTEALPACVVAAAFSRALYFG